MLKGLSLLPMLILTMQLLLGMKLKMAERVSSLGVRWSMQAAELFQELPLKSGTLVEIQWNTSSDQINFGTEENLRPTRMGSINFLRPSLVLTLEGRSLTTITLCPPREETENL